MNMIKMKSRVLSVVAACCSFFMATPVAAQPVDTLSVWMMDNGLGSQKAMQRIVKNFQKESGIPVNVRVLNWGEAFDEISKALSSTDSSASLPDVIQLGSTWVAHFAAKGQIRSIDFLMDQMDSTRFLVEGLKSSHIDDKPGIYSLPWFLDVRGLYANERQWNELEICDSNIATYPKFMGTLRAVATAPIRNAKGVAIVPFALPGKNDWTGPQQMAPFIWGYGGKFIERSARGLHSALLDSATLAGIAVYAKILGDADLAPNSLSENSAQNADRFIQSEQLFLVGTSELIRQLEFPVEEGGLKTSLIDEDGIVMVPPPAGPVGRFSFVGGSHLALSAKTDTTKYAKAEKLFAYLLSANNIDAYSRSVGFLPADKSIISIWNQDPRYSRLIADLENGRSFPNIPEWGSIENELIQLANKMGEAFAKNANEQERSRILAELVLDAHKRINVILKYGEVTNDKLLIPIIASQLLIKDLEDRPTNLNIPWFMTPFPVKRFALALAILAILSVLYVGFRLFARFYRDRSSHKN